MTESDKKIFRNMTAEEKREVLDWMLKKDGDTYITIVNKKNAETRIIDKYARVRKGDWRL